MLQDDDATVRLAVAETWPATVDAGQEAPLRPLLADSDARVRARTAARLLGSRRRDEARETLLEMANSDEPEWRAEAVGVALESLHAPDPAQRANALEMLEVVGEPEVVRPLLEVWETHRLGPKEPHAALSELLGEPDRWLRACAAHAAPAQPQLRAAVEALASSDPDALVRTAAREALRREERVETLRGARRPPWGRPRSRWRAGDRASTWARWPSSGARPGWPRSRPEATLTIDRRRFERILRERPEASLAVMRVLCDRLRAFDTAEPLSG